MVKLKVLKRDSAAINNAVDFNNSVFRYFADGSEIKEEKVKSGLKSAFLGMLDNIVIPDDFLYMNQGDWSFLMPVASDGSTGSTTVTTNTYTGVKYIYRQAQTTTTVPAVLATPGSYTGSTYRLNPLFAMGVGTEYVLEPDLSKATHGKEIRSIYRPLDYWGGSEGYPTEYDDDGTLLVAGVEATRGTYIGQLFRGSSGFEVPTTDLYNARKGVENYDNYQPLTFFGGTMPTPATVETTSAGFYPAILPEVATHGKNGDDFLPLGYWNEDTVLPTSSTGEFKGKLLESQSGFSIQSEKVGLTLTSTGEALSRYTPLEVITFVTLIKMAYHYRSSSIAEQEI